MPSVAAVIVCVPSQGSASVAPCDALSGGVFAPSVVSGHVLSDAEYAVFVDATQPFDGSLAAQYFSYSFGSVIALWLLAFGVGLVMRTVRSS